MKEEAKRTRLRKTALAAMLAGACALLVPAMAAEQAGYAGLPAEKIDKTFPAKPVYSPYANRDFPNRPLFGDTHLHTTVSMDAGASGTRLEPRDAYRLARGERVISNTGRPVKLSRPLDFLVVADHSEGPDRRQPRPHPGYQGLA